MQQDLQANPSEEEVLMGHYKVLKTLGTGNFAQVKLALHLHTQVQVALKTLEKDKKNAALIENELEIMKFLDHPNIIKLFHVMETTEHIYMVLEYASGGDLAGRILQVNYMQEGEARHIFTQMVCAVNYCHENGIAHRDIKPENILMDANRDIRLCDFGLAIKVTTEQTSTVFCGTLPYCAPELFSSQGYDPRALDIWSMGVVLYIMVTKHYPFKATTYEKMKEEMQEPHYYIPPKVPALIANLIVKLFTVDPGRRPKIRDIMEHQWLKGSEELSKLTLSRETHPSKPNPSIMTAMWGMGYNPKDIRDSLHEKKFNSVMATYLILKHQSSWVDNTNHSAKFLQPDIATAPADPPTFHLVLKRIGSEPDHHSPTQAAECQFHDDDKLVRKEDRKNHSMPAILCCLQKSLPHPTGAQCGPAQHDYEQLPGSSPQKRSMASEGLPCGPEQHAQKQVPGSRLQKRSTTSKSVSCGPAQHDVQVLGNSLRKKNMVSKSVSCGPAQHTQKQLPGSRLQKRSMVSKSVSCGPMKHDEQLLGTVSKGVSCGSLKHDMQLLGSRLRKRSMASKSVSCGPVQHAQEKLPGSRLRKRSTASKSVSCGPVQHDVQLLGSSPQKKNMVSKGVFCGPVQHDMQLLSSRLQKRSMVSKSVSCGPMQHSQEKLLSSSQQKKNMVSKSVSCGPVQHDEQLLGTVSKGVSCGSLQHDMQLLGSRLRKRSVASKSVSCGPVQHAQEKFPGSRLQKRSTASKSVSCGPVQHGEKLLGTASKSVSCGPMKHDVQLLGSSPQKKNMVSKGVSCGPVYHDEQLLGILSENRILQVEPQSENSPKSSSSLPDTLSIRSSSTDTHHKDRSFSPQETSESNLTSAQPQRGTAASPHNLWSGWKRVKRRMAKCLRRLCCCLPAQRRSCTSQRRVAPQE